MKNQVVTMYFVEGIEEADVELYPKDRTEV